MIRASLLVCVLLLSACASRAPLPAQIPHLKLPIQLHAQRNQAGRHDDMVVEIKKRNRGVRWLLTSPSGALLAQQDLTNDGWKASHAPEPDAEARELFAAVLFALTSSDEVRFDYPGVQLLPQGRSLEERWRVSYGSQGSFRISLADGLSYLVTPLKGEAHR